MSHPACHRTALNCTHCGAETSDECPYDSLSPELLEARPPMMLSPDAVCSLNEECENCQ